MDLAAAVTVPGKAEEFVRIRNLSADGALLDVSADVGVAGDTLRLVCHVVVDGLRRTLTIDGVIQHVRPSPTAKGTLEYGVEFRDLREIEALWLRCLVYQRIAEGHLTQRPFSGVKR
jgi:hypothetical protein